MRSLVGQVLGGRYEVRREIARGGMGAVLEAHDRRLDRLVAIKTSLADAEQARLRLVDEAQVTGTLRHPSIVSVFELGQEAGQPFLVMKLVAGRTLAKVARDPFEGDALRRRLRMFLRVAEAIGAAHERGVIHRDLKPQNVMVGPDGEVLVLDWGLARPIASDGQPVARSAVREALARGELLGPDGAKSGDLTIEGAVVGTAAYMPMEQADGRTLDARADVYALGATLYELLSGKAPYQGSTFEVLAALFQYPPPPLRELAPAVPEPVAAIVARAMGREVDARYPDARALARDVEAFLDERPVSVWREPPAAAARRLARRHRGALVTAALGLLLVTGGGVAAREVVARRTAVVRAHEQDAAADVAEARAQEARARGAAQLEAAAGEALRALREVVEADEASRRAVPLADVDAKYRRARAALDGASASLGTIAPQADVADLVSSLVATIGDARRRADLMLARALVARAPGASVERLRALAEDPLLAPELGLLQARALVRAGRPEEARVALRAADVAGRDDLRVAARALELDLAGAPAQERVDAWTVVVLAWPRAGWARLGRAEAHTAAGQAEDADDDYDRAQMLDPTDPWTASTRIERATPQCRDWVITKGTLGLVPLLTGELPAWEKPVELALLWRGLVQYQPLSLDLRQLARDTGLERAPLAVAAVVGMRRARTMNRPEQVLTLARGLLEREPLHREARGHMAWALARLHRADEVERLCKELLPRWPEDPDLEYALGLVLWRDRRRPAEAAPHLALGARPRLDPASWVELAWCLIEAGQPGRAVDAARRAASLHPGDFEAAAPDVELSPRVPVIPLALGDALAASGDPARAVLHHLQAYFEADEFGVECEALLSAGADLEALGLPEVAKAAYLQAVGYPHLVDAAEARLRALGVTPPERRRRR